MPESEATELQAFRSSITSGDAPALRRLLTDSENLRGKVNAPMFFFGQRPINAAAKHLNVIDVLLEFGADINLRSDWHAGPFGVLDSCPEDIARELLSRGAILTAHAAARFGWLDELREIVQAIPAVVHEKGGDGQRPLHFAKTPTIADYLLDHGAEIDARCVDHNSTAAQYALKDRPEVSAHLIQRGAKPDIFMAARLGDFPLAERLIDANPNCLAARINIKGYDPVPVFGIYCWVLGFYRSPHDVADEFGHRDLYELFVRRSSPKIRFLNAAMRAEADAARFELQQDPTLTSTLTAEDHSLLAYAALHNLEKAFALMLELGFDPNATGLDGGTVLHMAAWVANTGMIQELLKRGVDIHALDPTHGASPLSWVAYGSVHRRCEKGDYAKAIKMLVDAGADIKAPGNKYGATMTAMAEGNPKIQQFLRELGAT